MKKYGNQIRKFNTKQSTKKDLKKHIDKLPKKQYNTNISYPNLLKGEIIYEKNGENNGTLDS